ncbi:hypothetical protein C8J57DRAFT_1291965 [Mycena rebaudengoi]|nr:hypothetical protein C8J57DRAFT_1291965 [Mycena rebaudengoi]
MSRRSARLQTLDKNTEEYIPAQSPEIEDDEDEFAPKTKRRKVKVHATDKTGTVDDPKVKKIRGRRGLLSSLKEFPMDVLFEIFGHLNPLDLLHLSRTTKEIRGTLPFVWKESRRNIQGLPDIPPELSEPQYANLAFDAHCHSCFSTPVQNIIWGARRRLCKKCMHEDFAQIGYVSEQSGLDRVLFEFVPSIVERQTGRGRRWRQTITTLYSLEAAKKLNEECAEFRDEKGALLSSDARFLEWRAQKTEEASERRKHVALCVAWAEDRTTNRSNELDEARRLRREAIIARLTSLGWGHEEFADIEFKNHKLVRQPKELTDRIWKNIEAPLIEHLTGLKTARLAEARARILRERRQLAASVYKKWKETHPPDAILPPKIDAVSNEAFRVVIEDTPIEPEEKWNRCKINELVQIMNKVVPDAGEDDLRLASTFFSALPSGYHSTSAAIGYPRILVHSMASTIIWAEHIDEDASPLQQIQFHEQAFRTMRSVIEACGLDPDVTTTTEMNEIDPRVECLNCHHETLGRWVMPWIQTVAHHCGEKAQWKCLTRDEEILAKAEEMQAASSWSPFTHPGDIYNCGLCVHPKMYAYQLRAHMQDHHSNLSGSISLNNVTFDIDAPIGSLHPRPVRIEGKVAGSEPLAT